METKATKTKKVTKEDTFVLADETVFAVRQLLQLALLTGTNVVHHLKTMRLNKNAKGELVPTAEFVASVQKMVSEFETDAAAMEKESGVNVSGLPGLVS